MGLLQLPPSEKEEEMTDQQKRERLGPVFLDGPEIHAFEGWTFEFSRAGGPWPLKKNGEPCKRAGEKFFAMFERWTKQRDIESVLTG